MKSGTLVPALSCCLVLLGVASALTAESSPRPVSISSETSVRGTKAAEPCVAGPNRLCLNDTRFGIEVLWTDFDHNQGLGTVALPPTDDSGLFWFFSESNWELLVKVLDGCTFNDHFWVFSAATTNTAYTLRVTDHVTDIVREYFNPLGQSAPAITDTTAFPTCSQPGEGPAVFMFADPSDLGVGSSSLITLIARRADGSAAGPGERIQLSAELGQVTGEVFTDSQGEALAIFTAGQQPGRGRVTASFLDGESSSIELTIREPQQDAELLVFANPSVLAIGDISIITVIARDSDGISLGAGQRIRLVADLGDVGPEVFTDEHGEAEAIFRASYQPGQATVTAIMEGKSPARRNWRSSTHLPPSFSQPAELRLGDHQKVRPSSCSHSSRTAAANGLQIRRFVSRRAEVPWSRPGLC